MSGHKGQEQPDPEKKSKLAKSGEDKAREVSKRVEWESLTDFRTLRVPYDGQLVWATVITGQEYLRELHVRFIKVRLGKNVGFLETSAQGMEVWSKASLTLMFCDWECAAVVQEDAPDEQDAKRTIIQFSPAEWFFRSCPLAVIAWRTDRPRVFREAGILYFNPFRGFPCYRENVSGEMLEAAEVLLAWIKRIICTGEDRVFEFLLDFMAKKRQSPFTKIGKMIALTGAQGTGKNTFLQRIFGGLFPEETFAYIINYRQLQGQFNGELEGKLLVFLDEAVLANAKSSADVLKGYTNPTLTVHQKGMTPYLAENRFEVLIASNSHIFAPVEAGDRRYLILQVSSKEKDMPGAMRAVFQAIDAGGLIGLDKILRERVVKTDFMDNNAIPLTDTKLHNLLNGLPGWLRALVDAYVINELISKSRNVERYFKGPIQAQDLFACIKEAGGIEFKVSQTKFGRDLREFFPRTFVKMPRSAEGVKYDIDPSQFIPELAKLTGVPEDALRPELDQPRDDPDQGGPQPQM